MNTSKVDSIGLENKECSEAPGWTPPEPANSCEIMSELRHSRRFGNDVRIGLIYPGSSLDFSSFWLSADPDWIVMIDPLFSASDMSLEAAMSLFRSYLSKQLLESEYFESEVILFDMDQRTANILHNHSAHSVAAFARQSPFRLAIASKFRFRGRWRQLTFVIGWYEDLPSLNLLPNPPNCNIFSGIEQTAHIAYEHKSMISTQALMRGVIPGGCLVWGLPNDAQKVQWSLPSSPE